MTNNCVQAVENRRGRAADEVGLPNTLAAICPGKYPSHEIYVVHLCAHEAEEAEIREWDS